MKSSSRLLLSLAAGGIVGALARSSAAKSSSSGLQGLGKASEGIMGSPFVVECVTDQKSLKWQLEFMSGARGRNGQPMSEQSILEEATECATTCTWRCIDDREVKVAKFRNRLAPEDYAILAKSAKGDGGWQMNWFDKDGPYGDSPRATQCEALAELSSGYKFRGNVHTVEGEAMSNWYLEEWI